MELNIFFFFFSFASLFFAGVHSAKFTITNNCGFTIWPGVLTGSGPPVSPTGFELASKESSTIDVTAPWSGRFWARTHCKTDALGKFTCGSGDCGSGQVSCNGAGAVPPASLIELTIKENGEKDFYDISLVDGYNLPVSLAPRGGSGDCKPTSCPADVNTVCPPELAIKGPNGSIVGCKSACLAFNEPQYCCTRDFNLPTTCPPTKYSKIFKDKCPEAYSYAYDDSTSTFTCSGSPNYAITFCP